MDGVVDGAAAVEFTFDIWPMAWSASTSTREWAAVGDFGHRDVSVSSIGAFIAGRSGIDIEGGGAGVDGAETAGLGLLGAGGFATSAMLVGAASKREQMGLSPEYISLWTFVTGTSATAGAGILGLEVTKSEIGW